MRKRLISFIMTMAMILSMNVTLHAEAVPEKYDDAILFSKTVGIFNETANAENQLKRAEMARIICAMLDMMPDVEGEWYNEVFKESNTDVTVETFSKGLKYEDVKPTDDFYSHIKTVSDRGIMVGASETEFRPDSPMTYMQFLKVLLCVMGYNEIANMQGGYPNGYISVIDNIGFEELSGKAYNEHITVGEAAYVIYKNLDTPVASAKYTSGDGWSVGYDDTFGEKVLGIYKYTNRINAIGNITLYEKECPDNTVLVGETLFNVSKGYEIDEKLFAREVNVYYTEDDGDVGPVIFAELTEKDEAVSFSIEKLEEFTSESISYLDGAKIKKVKIKNGAYFISNGEQLLQYDKESFNFDYGEVTLVKSRDENAYDIIIVEGYNSVYVLAIDQNKQFIYGNEAKAIELSVDEENYKILKGGEVKDFSAIMEHNIIDVSESSKRIKIIVPEKNKKVIKVTGSSEDEGTRYVTATDGEQLEIAKSFTKSSDFIKPRIGTEYTVILNNNGSIAWIEKGTTDGNVGYFIKAINDEETERALIKFLKDDGETEIFTCVEKLTIADADGVEHKGVTADKVKGYFINSDGSDYNGLVRYSLDKDRQIKKVEIPVTNPEITEEGRFYDLMARNGYTTDTGYFVGWAWGQSMFLNSSFTKAIFWPSQDGDDSRHRVTAYGEVPADIDVKAKFYGTNPYGIEAEYMLYLNDAQVNTDKGYARPKDFKTWAVVKSRKAVYDDTIDAVVDKMTVVTLPTSDVSGNQEIEMTALYEYKDKHGRDCTILDIANDAGQSKDSKGEIRTYSIGKGDVIYYSADSYNEVQAVSVIYKADMKNPYADKQEKLGWLAGTSDDYRSANDNEKKYSNPYSFSSSQLLASGLSYNCDKIRVHKVSPYRMDDYSYTATSMDLNTYDWKDGTIRIDGLYRSHYLNGKRYPINGYTYYSRGLTVTLGRNGNIEIKPFVKSDMKPAEVYGKECSTVIELLTYSHSAGIIVINDER